MTTTAMVGPGFLIDFEDPDVPNSFIHLVQARDINGPTETTTIVDVTNQDSPDNFTEKRPSLQDGGTVTADLVANPAASSQRAILDLKHTRTRTRWRIVELDTGWVVVFGAYVTGFGYTFPYQGAPATRSLTLTVDGPVEEVAPGSGS